MLQIIVFVFYELTLVLVVMSVENTQFSSVVLRVVLVAVICGPRMSVWTESCGGIPAVANTHYVNTHTSDHKV